MRTASFGCEISTLAITLVLSLCIARLNGFCLMRCQALKACSVKAVSNSWLVSTFPLVWTFAADAMGSTWACHQQASQQRNSLDWLCIVLVRQTLTPCSSRSGTWHGRNAVSPDCAVMTVLMRGGEPSPVSFKSHRLPARQKTRDVSAPCEASIETVWDVPVAHSAASEITRKCTRSRIASKALIKTKVSRKELASQQLNGKARNAFKTRKKNSLKMIRDLTRKTWNKTWTTTKLLFGLISLRALPGFHLSSHERRYQCC